MKLRNIIIIFLLALILTSCLRVTKPDFFKSDLEKKLDALSITLEANLEYRELEAPCELWRKLVSKFVVIPIKKEVIDSMLKYIAVRDKLNISEEKNLLQKTYSEFLSSNKSTFVIAIINNPNLEFGKNRIYFQNLVEDIYLINNRKKYALVDYTHNLSASLNPGWNEGYLHFQNFRQENTGIIKAYSLHFNGFNIVCDSSKVRSQDWALTFDESDINFVALIDKGLSKDEIRKNYNVNSFSTLNLTDEDILNLVKFVIRVLPI